LPLHRATAATGSNGSTLYNFHGERAGDGAWPDGGLIADASGNFYGVTTAGGSSSTCDLSTYFYGCGTVYEVMPGTPWTEKVLYSFNGGTDGVNPLGQLVFDPAGNLYGVTPNGGSSCPESNLGCGVVFKLSPPTAEGGAWTETILYSFHGGQDGANPQGGLALDRSGNLYGVTFYGGGVSNCGGCGTVFKLTPPAEPGGAWTETILHRFGNAGDGWFPVGQPVLDEHGNLYGTTGGGGSSKMGTVFQLRLAAKGGTVIERVIHTFMGVENGDGLSPAGGVTLHENKLYGVTRNGGTDIDCDNTFAGCGVAYELEPPAQSGGEWSETLLLSFLPGPDGETPQCAPVFDNSGNFYSVDEANWVDASNVFELSPPAQEGGSWTETNLYSSATGTSGAGYPLVITSGVIYGVAYGGGPSNDGLVFAVTP